MLCTKIIIKPLSLFLPRHLFYFSFLGALFFELLDKVFFAALAGCS